MVVYGYFLSGLLGSCARAAPLGAIRPRRFRPCLVACTSERWGGTRLGRGKGRVPAGGGAGHPGSAGPGARGAGATATGVSLLAAGDAGAEPRARAPHRVPRRAEG